MRVAIYGVALIGAALAIAGCRSGYSPGLPQDAPAEQAPSLARGTSPAGATGTIVIVLPTIVPPEPLPTPPPGDESLLASKTAAISGTFGNVAFGPLDISSGSQNCQADAGGGRSCTVRFHVPAGSNDLLLSTYGSNSRDGVLATTGSTRLLVRPGILNYLPPLKWYGVAHGVRIAASPKTLTEFKPSHLTLTVYGVDGAGAPIPESRLIGVGGGRFATATTSSGVYNQRLIVKNFFPTYWPYDGQGLGIETFSTVASVRKTVVGKASVQVTIGPGNASSIGQIIAGSHPSFSDYVPNTVEFAAAESGNVWPLRTLVNTSGYPFGARDDGSFWMGTQRYDTAGDLLGTIVSPRPVKAARAVTVDSAQNEYVVYSFIRPHRCRDSDPVLVYAPNSYGKKTLRKLVLSPGCTPTELAVDGTGVLYVGRPGAVLEFAPNANGNVPPIRTISGVNLSNLVADASGNLFALTGVSETTGTGSIVEYPAGMTTATQVLPGIGVGAFALDGQGNIYAEVPSSSTTFEIEEFPAGTTTPTRVIGGAKTTLAIPAGIAVTP